MGSVFGRWFRGAQGTSSQAEIAETYRRFVPMVRKRARALMRDDDAAEDLVQDVFIKYFEGDALRETVRDTAAFLYRMTTHLAYNRLRDERTRRRLLAQNAAGGQPPEALIEERITLQAVLADADQEQAEIAIYYYIDGMEQEEIAELLGMNRRTVGRQLERFREFAERALRKP